MNSYYLLRQTPKKIFFLVFVIPLVLQLFLINLIKFVDNKLSFILSFIFFGVLYLPYFIWLKISVNFLVSKSTKFFKLNIKFFQINLILSFLFILVFLTFIAYIFSFLLWGGGKPNSDIFIYFALIQFFCILSYAYNCYFISNLISSIKLKRNVRFNELASNIFTFSFPPFTIWAIQKQVKEILTSENSKSK